MGDGGAVQRVDDLGALLALGAVADAEALRLEVGRVRSGGDLAVPLLVREHASMSYFFAAEAPRAPAATLTTR